MPDVTENEIAKIVVDTCFRIHCQFGPGLYESVYEEILCFELAKKGILFSRQVAVPVIYEEFHLDHGFRADIIIEGKVIVEIKSIEVIAPVHFKQVLTYLKLTGIKLGILINFNVHLIKDGIHRIVNEL